MAKKKDKGPRPVEIVVAAVLSGILGVVGAVAFLVLQPPEEVTEMPAEEDREFGLVYYVTGKGGNASHGTWLAKKEAVKTKRSGNLALVEEELNQWAAQKLKETAEIEKPLLHIEAGMPNFRIAEDSLFVGVPLTWSMFGFGRTFDSHTSGRFKNSGAGYGFEHDRVYVGSCPVPGLLANRLVNDVVASYAVPEELNEGWNALESVALEESSLKLVIP
ncbi:MAG: hypothetical protein WD490_07440 [Opitutales bacterium]